MPLPPPQGQNAMQGGLSSQTNPVSYLDIVRITQCTCTSAAGQVWRKRASSAALLRAVQCSMPSLAYTCQCMHDQQYGYTELCSALLYLMRNVSQYHPQHLQVQQLLKASEGLDAYTDATPLRLLPCDGGCKKVKASVATPPHTALPPPPQLACHAKQQAWLPGLVVHADVAAEACICLSSVMLSLV